MSKPRILPDSLRHADGGTVTCTLATPEGPVQGTIARSFFDEFAGVQPLAAGTEVPELPPQRRLRIAADNLAYLEAQAELQLRITGPRSLVLR